ncbi:MAG TPA: PQQ-dependent sugar dehydrogenase, partial [Lacipirellulaceae bacterium]|nr:PQQ-dependent sugar dehydrogenase [Lacipirellulaceae bacterium]
KTGFANGLITFAFDPDYQNNGKFYTVHMEDPIAVGAPTDPPRQPKNTVSYLPTDPITTPGGSLRQTVLLEWTDTNIANSTFEGTARELLRLNMSGQIHPTGDLIFNPNAGPGDPDWRVLYIAVGDGGARESPTTATRRTPQRLDSLGGKILRIIPDLSLHGPTSSLSPNGQYRIPNDNPFTSINNSAVRDEVFALGLRNPHRISWDPDTDTILVNDIGLRTWEEVNVIQHGGNYGYSEIEGNQVLGANNFTNDNPLPATIPRRINSTTTSGTMTPIYPVLQYGHGLPGQTGFAGDSISSGYVYRGSNIPSLYGKYIFGDITTGQLMWADFDEMLAAHDGDSTTMATIHSLNLVWNDPHDAPDQ